MSVRQADNVAIAARVTRLHHKHEQHLPRGISCLNVCCVVCEHMACMWCRGFIQYYFQCSACANHFVTMTEQPDAESVTSKRDAVLWMWKAHNQVQHAQHLVRAACQVVVQACVPCNTANSFADFVFVDACF